MESFDDRKMPTPLLGLIHCINSLLFTGIGGVTVYLYMNYSNNKSILSFYGIIMILACYIAAMVILYVILRLIFNRYIHYIYIRSYMSMLENPNI